MGLYWNESVMYTMLSTITRSLKRPANLDEIASSVNQIGKLAISLGIRLYEKWNNICNCSINQ